MLLIEPKLIADVKILLDGVAHRIQTPISHGRDHPGLTAVIDRHLRSDAVHLPEMALVNMEYRSGIDIVI